jgi:transposase
MARDIAVDVHRKALFVVILDPEGKEVLVRRFATTAAGEAELLAQLQAGDRVVLEATGGAHRLANRLESVGTTVLIADPQQARLVGMRGKKTDYRDCRALLKHLRSGELATVWRPDVQTREIRQLTRERAAYNQGIVRLKNRIRALLWEEGLELPTDAWEDVTGDWLAETTLAVAPRRILQREWAALQALLTLKQCQDEELAAHARALPTAQRLMQLPGFGAATAVMFLGEVGSVERFGTAKQLVSYAGLDPRVNQSDEHTQHGAVSKAGRRQLRWLMIEVAWAHVAAGGPEAAHYHRLLKRGKPKGVAITALARRLLVLAYALLLRQENYRRLDVARYEGKLTRLAAGRPVEEEEEESNVDWAADRLETLTGQASPYRQAHPRSRPGRRVRCPGRRQLPAPERLPSATARPPLSEFPASRESDPSESGGRAGESSMAPSRGRAGAGRSFSETELEAVTGA